MTGQDVGTACWISLCGLAFMAGYCPEALDKFARNIPGAVPAWNTIHRATRWAMRRRA